MPSKEIVCSRYVCHGFEQCCCRIWCSQRHYHSKASGRKWLDLIHFILVGVLSNSFFFFCFVLCFVCCKTCFYVLIFFSFLSFFELCESSCLVLVLVLDLKAILILLLCSLSLSLSLSCFSLSCFSSAASCLSLVPYFNFYLFCVPFLFVLFDLIWYGVCQYFQSKVTRM